MLILFQIADYKKLNNLKDLQNVLDLNNQVIRLCHCDWNDVCYMNIRCLLYEYQISVIWISYVCEALSGTNYHEFALVSKKSKAYVYSGSPAWLVNIDSLIRGKEENLDRHVYLSGQ